ncbi:MAG: hypothetical protein ACYTFG_22010, partial [Planctomycetota bacterium]
SASPYIPRVLGDTEFAQGKLWDLASKAGYYVVLYLPASPNSATSRYGSNVDTDLAEQHWIAYAWPQVAGKSGIRVFVIGPTGQPYSFANSGYRYSGNRAPPFDAALKRKSEHPWVDGIDDGGPGNADQAGMNWIPCG